MSITIRVARLLGAAATYPLLEAVRTLGKLFPRIFSGFGVVIYYHRVPPEHAARFARQMDHLCRWTNPYRADRVESLQTGTRPVIVTFDDGWESFYSTALPELERRNIPVTLFAIAGRLGEQLKNDTYERLITADELQSLPRDLVTIGSHTVTHADLSKLVDEEIRRELRDSRTILEELTGREIDLFCFPFGIFTEHLVRLCAIEGYQRVFTGVPSLARSNADEFAIGRIAVEPTDWLLEFHLKICGAYCWVPWAIAAKRAIRSRLDGISLVLRSLTGRLCGAKN